MDLPLRPSGDSNVRNKKVTVLLYLGGSAHTRTGTCCKVLKSVTRLIFVHSWSCVRGARLHLQRPGSEYA